MAGRVEEDPERRTRLVLVLGRTQLEDGCLACVEVVDHDVDVHLLGHVLARPLRRRVVVDLLEAQAVAVVGSGVGPVVGDLDLPVEQGAVELGKGLGVGAVEDDRREACDSHGRHASEDSGRSVTGSSVAAGQLARERLGEGCRATTQQVTQHATAGR